MIKTKTNTTQASKRALKTTNGFETILGVLQARLTESQWKHLEFFSKLRECYFEDSR